MVTTRAGTTLSKRWLGSVDAPSVRDRLERERIRILSTILTAGTLVSAGMLVLVPLWREHPVRSIVGYGLSLVLHVAHLALLRSGRPLLAARSFSVLYFLLVTGLVYAYGGVRGVGGFVYPLVVLFAGLTWSAWAALGMAAASSAVALAMALLETGGMSLPIENTLTPGSAWGVITAAVAMTAVMLLVALRVLRASSDEAIESERRRRELELGLARAQRMEALGQLASGLAHDFNNMLTGIIGHAELLVLKSKDEELARHARLVLRTGERAASLTQQLLTYSRKRERVVEPVAINGLVGNVVAILERSLGRRIAVEVDLAADPDVVAGDPAELESALLNLVINGRDAMAEGGLLRITTESSSDEAGGVAAGRTVRVRVSDTGAGIPVEHLEHVFEPYFTTKEGGKGTGLGLATVLATVEDHGGTVAIEKTGASGTTLLVTLPACDPVAARVEPLPRPLAASRPLSVLVVDDEPAALEAMCSMLAELGHATTATEDPLEAIEILKGPGADIDLAIVDLVMPELSGRQVLERIRELGLEVPVILSTGTFGEPLELEALGGRVSLLPKPYRRAELASTIAELVGSDGRAGRADRKGVDYGYRDRA